MSFGGFCFRPHGCESFMFVVKVCLLLVMFRLTFPKVLDDVRTELLKVFGLLLGVRFFVHHLSVVPCFVLASCSSTSSFFVPGTQHSGGHHACCRSD